MLKDSDGRIRNEAAIAIFELNTLQLTRKYNAMNKYSGNHLAVEFLNETLSIEIPFSLENSAGALTGFQPALCRKDIDRRQLRRMMGKHLFDLTNMLFDLKTTEQLVWNGLKRIRLKIC